MTEQFAAWREALGEMPDRAEAVTASLSNEQLLWKPAPQTWSIAQCLDHLNRSNAKIVAQLEAGILASKAGTDGRTWKPATLERLFIRMVGANAPIKSPVPPDFVPADEPALDTILVDFRILHERLRKCIDETENRNLVTSRIVSPVSHRIKCSVGTWFAATIEHDSYHLGQAEQVRRELDAKLLGGE